VKGFALQTGSLYWSDKEMTLYVGFDQGRVVRLKVDESCTTYTELAELGPHTLRVMGIWVNNATGNLYSISDAGTFKITEKNTGTTVADIKPTETVHALKEMITFDNREILAVCNAVG
jgi:FlaG/FlaF family flagellin (archaellin)